MKSLVAGEIRNSIQDNRSLQMKDKRERTFRSALFFVCDSDLVDKLERITFTISAAPFQELLTRRSQVWTVIASG